MQGTLKGCRGRERKEIKKEVQLIVRVLKTMFFSFRETGGGARFELKIREKGQFSRTSDVGAYT